MIIPRGIAKVSLRNMSALSWVEEEILCDVEIMMACFTKRSCRVRLTVLEDKNDYVKGENLGNINTTLTDGLLKIIADSVQV